MDFHTEMDEVEEFLRSKKYPVHVGNNKGKKANFRRKCQAFTIQDDCLKYVHKPNRKDITEVRFLRVIKDRQYQLDIVLASHRGSGYSDESVALGGHVGREKVVDRIMQRYWWRKIVSDVNETIKTCLRCQKSSTVFKKVDSKLHSIPIKPQIMHQIGIDLCSLTKPTISNFSVRATISNCPDHRGSATGDYLQI
ncbi:zinc finger and BTB domain-containing protein 11-like isoform X2 [Oratosquilla oratoria]|uniref:zinc finger and BTB domain-containing protein 11-like isoform X2 n=1 Tax=Oratosquilla oratoria TaxID=337810 RepID=UPI003F76696D